MTTYYVDATAGLDANSGLTEALAWQTIAKVNASTFAAGDSILFKRGETWREQLTVPSSGSSGNPITFGAYGAGAKPIISGAELVTGWTNSLTMHVGDTTSGGTTAMTLTSLYFFKLTPASSGTLLSYKFWAGTTAGGNFTAALYTDNAGVPGVPIANSTTGLVAFSANSWATLTPASAISVSVTAGTSYWIAAQASVSYQTSVAGGSGAGVRIKGSNTFNTFPSNPSGLVGSGDASLFHKYIVIDISVANVWSAPLTTQPNNVLLDGVLAPLRETSLANLSVANEWFWTGGNLYLYSTTNPATLYSGQGVEASVRNYCILNAKDDVTIQDIDVYGSNGLANIMGMDAGDFLSNRLTVRRCEVHHSYTHGIYFYGAVDGLVAENHIHDCWDGRAYGDGSATAARGVMVYGSNTDNVDVKNNLVEDCYLGIWMSTGAKDVSVHHNLVLRSKINGIDVFQNNVAANPVLIYNNTVHHRPSWAAGHGIDIQDTGSRGIDIKNNIIYCDFTGTNTNVQLLCLAATDYAAVISDYNCLHKAAGCTADVGKLQSGTVYATLSLWQAALASNSIAGGDVHSIDTDPLVANLTSDFTLQSSSPCIAAGTDVGLTLDYAGNPVGNPPSIGAYEYIVSTDGGLFSPLFSSALFKAVFSHGL